MAKISRIKKANVTTDNLSSITVESSLPQSTDPVKDLSKSIATDALIDESMKSEQGTGEDVLSDVEKKEQPVIERTMSARQILANIGVINAINDSIDEEKKPYKLHVTLRKMPRNGFRLGMEKSEENYQLVPGTGQTFVPFMKGDRYITGLEDKPDIRKRLEKALGVSLETDSKFYEELTFRMEDRKQGQLMVIENGFAGARVEALYYCMIASPIIANGMQEYTSGKKPEASWYIENKEAEAEEKQKNISNEMAAYGIFADMSPTRRAQLAKILGIKVWGLSEPVIKTTLWDYLKTSKQDNQGINTVVKFLQEAGKSDTEITVKALVQDAIFYNVIRLNSARDFIYGEENLGGSVEAVETKLMSPKNIQLRAGIEEKINLKSV